MSAFLVSKIHIDVLVSVAKVERIRYLSDSITDSDAESELGRLLWRENMKSLRARYNDKIDEALLASYSYTPPRRHITPIEVVKAIHCYEYQTCEHKGWTKSDARKVCEQIESHMIRKLPGYSEAAWGF